MSERRPNLRWKRGTTLIYGIITAITSWWFQPTLKNRQNGNPHGVDVVRIHPPPGYPKRQHHRMSQSFTTASWERRHGWLRRITRRMTPIHHMDVVEIHPWSLTWNLKINPWNRRFLLETIIFRFHVKLWGGMLKSLTFEPFYYTFRRTS